jgi:molybdopterin molybdotransferase
MMRAEDMISVEEARARILAVVPRLEPEMRALPEALGQVLAEDVVSGLTIPSLNNTAMDGYAVIAADTAGASESAPVRLKVAGQVAAGYIYAGRVEPGTAVRIMTGAPVPEGADAVVPFEETDEAPAAARPIETVAVLKEAKPGANLRFAGEDIRSGEVVLKAGTQVGPAQIGVLASLGLTEVRVYRRPVVAILSTGDELLELGQTHEPGLIFDANSYSVMALVTEAGGIPRRLGIARDTMDDLTAKVHEGLDADLLVTSAGVSRGDYDVVKDVLMKEGEIGFWTVRMRPGKPLAFGSFRSGGRIVPHIGLPGNPVSSMVTFELFGRPAIFKMMGRGGWERPMLRVTVEDRVVNADGRRFYARAVVSRKDGRYLARLTGSQGSGVLTSMALANALVICPEFTSSLEPGEEADAVMLGPVP